MIQRWTVKRFVVRGPSLSIPDYWFGLGKKRVVYVRRAFHNPGLMLILRHSFCSTHRVTIVLSCQGRIVSLNQSYCFNVHLYVFLIKVPSRRNRASIQRRYRQSLYRIIMKQAPSPTSLFSKTTIFWDFDTPTDP